MIRVAAAGTSRKRAIHCVVISAATVIFITATSYSKGSRARASVCRSAGAASLPVTKRYLSATGRASPRARPRRALASALAEDELVGRALEGALGVGPPQHGFLDAPGQGEVLVGDAAARVRAQL